MTTPTIGLLYPGVGADDDFPRLEQRLAGTLRLPVAYTAGGDVAHEVDELLAVGSAANLAAGAKEILAESPDAIVWTCTSGSFVFGLEGARQQAQEITDLVSVPASSTSLAFAAACHALDAKAVSVAASYPEDVARHFAKFLADAGVQVLSMRSQGIATAGEVGKLGRQQVIEMAQAADHEDAAAVLIPDTAMHSLDWIEDIERELGKPVLTANQVSVWEGLRIAGMPMRINELGALFRL
ncbi:maleate cis-trans isomerase [Saxibacter everestensis]|uniref:Maleate cis-trans isomerase n=1 Tax=Saxibacter everestensis TaxID=2909229 RepID=A0ABY8QTW0_9MICO|nr:maleate cis-trans isomerase [Brevibacteriaceae bacterium ZFBP1038]